MNQTKDDSVRVKRSPFAYTCPECAHLITHPRIVWRNDGALEISKRDCEHAKSCPAYWGDALLKDNKNVHS